MDKVKLRDANEVDVIVDCPCGASFYVYVPDASYLCPRCSKIYTVTLVVSEQETGSDNWHIKPNEIRTED